MAAEDIPTFLELIQRELLLFGAFWLLIGALDDFLIDLIWIVRRVFRSFAYYRETPPMRAAELPRPDLSGPLAIFVPTWQEQDVIGQMLRQCSEAWKNRQPEYRIYVGCYPNDVAGTGIVEAYASEQETIKLVVCAHDGPTTKGDCLNQLWQAMLADEMVVGRKVKAVVLHDAEDAVDPLELRVFDYLIDKAEAVQLPVIPISAPGSRWISGHYCDEFAEAHGKTMVVREALGAALPLAGVACAIRRSMMGRLALDNDGKPFNAASLTEDYELGMRIGAAGGRTILARMMNSDGELVGTRACFPATFGTSVRQKARWLTGIALAGWDNLGWRGNLAQRWMLLHDRRSIFAAIVLFVAYACTILTSLLALFELLGLHRPASLSKTLILLLWVNFGFLLWRLTVRAAFVWSLYGPKEAARSIPRTLIANFVAIFAARSACAAYLRHCFGKPLIWDKTNHHVVPVNSIRHG